MTGCSTIWHYTRDEALRSKGTQYTEFARAAYSHSASLGRRYACPVLALNQFK